MRVGIVGVGQAGGRIADLMTYHSQWGKHQGVEKVKLLPDGNGEFSRKMGMLVEKTNLGFGMRSWRYSMVVDNEQVEKMFVEPGLSDDCPTDPFEASDADTMLAYLRAK